MSIQLILGGSQQGKTAYALAQTGVAPEDIVNGETFDLDALLEKPLLDDFHEIIRRLLLQKMDPIQLAQAIASRPDSITIVCNEVGCGVVPTDAFERQYRETVGRICCMLAQKAERVVRIQCGIPTILKGA